MPVSAKVFAWRAAICAAMAIWGVTCVPEARRAATLRAGFEAAAAAAAAAAIGAATTDEIQTSISNILTKSIRLHKRHYLPAAISCCCCCCFSNISFSFCSCNFLALSSLVRKTITICWNKNVLHFQYRNRNNVCTSKYKGHSLMYCINCLIFIFYFI